MPYNSYSSSTSVSRPPCYPSSSSAGGGSTYHHRTSSTYLSSSGSSGSSSTSGSYVTPRAGRALLHSRTSSLDRSSSSSRDSTTSSSSSTSTYRPSSHLLSTSSASSTTSSSTLLRSLAASRPARASSYLNSSSDSTSASSALSRRMDLDLKTRFAKLEFGASLRSSGLRNVTTSTGSGSSGGGRSSACDAIHDHGSSSAVLTNYRHLGDSGASSDRPRRLLSDSSVSSLSTTTANTNTSGSTTASRRSSAAQRNSIDAAADSKLVGSSGGVDSDSGLSSSSSGSSSPSLSTGSNHGKQLSSASSSALLDENSNHRGAGSSYKYDSNHNHLFLPSSTTTGGGGSSGAGSRKNSGQRDSSNDTGNWSSPSVSSSSSNASSTSSSTRHSRFGSTDDVTGGSPNSSYSCSAARRRRTSGQASTSGYSSDASSSSNSSPGGSSFNRDKHESGGLVGLRNLGNTCFMNSVMQCLSNSRPLLDYCLRENYVADNNTTISSMKGALFKAFANLLQTMWKADSNDPAVNPQAFKSQIQKFAPRFMGYSQQDAQEFLRYLLQGLHEDINRVTSKPSPIHSDIDECLSDNQKALESWRRYLRFDDSKIVDLFVGQLKSTLKCTVCGHTSVTFDPFWDLSLPIPKASNSVKLNQCFDLFAREEVLDGDEKPTCSRCKTRRKCTKSFTIQKFPKILVMHLKRFSPSEKYRAKLTTNVDFPLYNLDLSSYATNANRGQDGIYNLYGISNHSGTVYTGHYTAICKHPYSGDWHDFNDSRVSKISTSSISSSEAYVLFYDQVAHSSRL